MVRLAGLDVTRARHASAMQARSAISERHVQVAGTRLQQLRGHNAAGRQHSGRQLVRLEQQLHEHARPCAKERAQCRRDLHYAHNGGFKIELYSAELVKVHEWADEAHWGCNVDGTVQVATLTLPLEPCADCVLRLVRQALEWGESYEFKSCALVTIAVTAPESDCGGCSSQGTCAAGGTCTCKSSPDSGFFYGKHCQYENECETDAHCGMHGKCITVGDSSGPAKQARAAACVLRAAVLQPSAPHSSAHVRMLAPPCMLAPHLSRTDLSSGIALMCAPNLDTWLSIRVLRRMA
jgi:hypothetical protein